MKVFFVVEIVIIIIGIAWAVIYFLPIKEKSFVVENREISTGESPVKLVDFSQLDPEFLFSAKIPNEFEVEYIPGLKATNIYDPNVSGKNNVEKSQMYITFFKASRFLTLSTVEITQQDKISINDKDAILYEITKKEFLPNFVGQPAWRNSKHKALDIRYSKDSPSYFYSFGQNPNLSQKIFDDVISSLIFIDN